MAKNEKYRTVKEIEDEIRRLQNEKKKAVLAEKEQAKKEKEKRIADFGRIAEKYLSFMTLAEFEKFCEAAKETERIEDE
jgi:hypothetical protein